ncbi:hypothetical protein D3C77_644500 [compost metagenome]
MFSGRVMTCTTTTVTPSISEVSTFLEIARKVHMPKKNAKAMFSTKTALTNRLT